MLCYVDNYNTLSNVGMIILTYNSGSNACSARTLLVGRQEELPACKHWLMRCCLEQGAVAVVVIQQREMISPQTRDATGGLAISSTTVLTFTDNIQNNLYEPAPTVKNCRLLLERRFTSHMPLLR